MTRRKANLGLLLLCSLLSCIFAAQSASAVTSTNTTAYTCSLGGTKDFKDSHCDEKVGTGEGTFQHEPIALNTTTELEVTNNGTKNATKEATNAVLKGELAGAKLEIVCTKVANEAKKAFLHNVEDKEPIRHTMTGEITTLFTGCKVEKPAKCTVKEPIVVAAEAVGVEGLESEGLKNTMGLEFKPLGGGKTFVTITLEGAECALKGTKFEVQGTAIATGTPAPTLENKHSGATGVFTNAMTKATLSIGGKPAEFSASTTTKMVGGNPVALTTVT